MTPIRLALVGAGGFVRNAHMPALLELRDQYEVVAVFSRTKENAAAIAAGFENSPDVYTELDPILAREDVEAVNLVLPIDKLASAVEQSLAAGKHVISEKPATPTVEEGRRLLEVYSHYDSLVWSVAENWRYEAAFTAAREHIPELGRLLTSSWAIANQVKPSDPKSTADWRRTGVFPGGFLLDGGVHQVAALRKILGEIKRVTAFTKQMQPYLPPTDTLVAALEFESGFIGSWSLSFASGSPFPNYLTIIGENGSLRVNPGSLEIALDGNPRPIEFERNNGVKDELADFARAVREGITTRNTPDQAVQDVGVIEAILRSGETGTPADVEQIVW